MPPHLGGIERVAESIVEGMGARGHEVRWISSAIGAPPGRDAYRLRVRALNLLEERMGVPYPLWSPTAAADIFAEVRRADVVHAHDCLYMGSVLAAAACRTTGTPFVVTQHVGYVPFGKWLDRVQKLAYLTLGRGVLSTAHTVVACAPHVPEFFHEIGVDCPFTLVRNGIDTSRFVNPSAARREALRAEMGIEPDRRVLLFSGRLVAKKGVARVAELQKKLASVGVVLVVGGDGPLAHLFADVPATRTLGAVDASRMPSLYALADTYVLPSHGEGLPLGVQESLLCGTEVVVSNDPAFRDGLNGLRGVRFVDTDDELFAATLASLDGPHFREEVRASALSRWGLEPFLDAYETIFDRALRGRPRTLTA